MPEKPMSKEAFQALLEGFADEQDAALQKVEQLSARLAALTALNAMGIRSPGRPTMPEERLVGTTGLLEEIVTAGYGPEEEPSPEVLYTKEQKP